MVGNRRLQEFEAVGYTVSPAGYTVSPVGYTVSPVGKQKKKNAYAPFSFFSFLCSLGLQLMG